LDKLWAPWRINYVSQKKPKGCFLCKAYKEGKDKKNFVIFRSKYCFVILNTFPYNNGHAMVVSNRHVGSLAKLNDAEVLDMHKALVKMKSILKKVLSPQGFNIGLNIGSCAGAGIDSHIHIHLVPRWRGDTNFMPVLTNTKIISQGLAELYKQCKEKIRQKDAKK
jgi:ATP adenylyltransferase